MNIFSISSSLPNLCHSSAPHFCFHLPELPPFLPFSPYFISFLCYLKFAFSNEVLPIFFLLFILLSLLPPPSFSTSILLSILTLEVSARRMTSRWSSNFDSMSGGKSYSCLPTTFNFWILRVASRMDCGEMKG